MKSVLIVLVLALGLTSCASVPRSPEQILLAAKATYAGTVRLMSAAARSGKVSDVVLVNRLEPARMAAAEAIDIASQLMQVGDPAVMDYVNAALAKAQSFRVIFEAITKPLSQRRFQWWAYSLS